MENKGWVTGRKRMRTTGWKLDTNGMKLFSKMNNSAQLRKRGKIFTNDKRGGKIKA